MWQPALQLIGSPVICVLKTQDQRDWRLQRLLYSQPSEIWSVLYPPTHSINTQQKERRWMSMHFYRQIQIHKWVVSFSFFLTSSLPASPFFLCVTKRGFINWVIGAAGAVQLNMSWIWIIGWTETEKRSDYLAYLFLFSVHACLWWEGSKVFSGCIFLEAHKYIGHWMSVQTASHVSKWHLAPGQI